MESQSGALSDFLVSVVIPVLDDAAGLAQTFASLPRDERLEVIVIDGGSSESTLQVIRDFNPSYSESGLDTGIADAMNRGITRANGEFIAILNAGDCWLPQTFCAITQAIAQYPNTELFLGTVEYFYPDGTRKSYRIEPRPERMGKRNWMFHPTLFIHKDCYARIGSYDLSYKLAMDSEWCHRALKASVRMVTLDVTLARMALGGRSDVAFVAALGEFRRSAIRHGQANRVTAWLWFLIVVLGKSLLRLSSAR